MKKTTGFVSHINLGNTSGLSALHRSMVEEPLVIYDGGKFLTGIKDGSIGKDSIIVVDDLSTTFKKLERSITFEKETRMQRITEMLEYNDVQSSVLNKVEQLKQTVKTSDTNNYKKPKK